MKYIVVIALLLVALFGASILHWLLINWCIALFSTTVLSYLESLRIFLYIAIFLSASKA